MGRAEKPQVYSGGLGQPHISISELHLLLSPESSPSDPSANTPSSYPTLSEVFGRKRKKRTSIETNIRLTLEKRFQDVSNQPPRVVAGGPACAGPTCAGSWAQCKMLNTTLPCYTNSCLGRKPSHSSLGAQKC